MEVGARRAAGEYVRVDAKVDKVRAREKGAGTEPSFAVLPVGDTAATDVLPLAEGSVGEAFTELVIVLAV